MFSKQLLATGIGLGDAVHVVDVLIGCHVRYSRANSDIRALLRAAARRGNRGQWPLIRPPSQMIRRR